MRAEITRDPAARDVFLMLADSWDAKATRAEHGSARPLPVASAEAASLAPARVKRGSPRPSPAAKVRRTSERRA